MHVVVERGRINSNTWKRNELCTLLVDPKYREANVRGRDGFAFVPWTPSFVCGVESNSIVASMSKWSYNKSDSCPSFFPQFGLESTNDTSVISYAWKTSLRLNSSNDGIKQCIFAKPFLIITFLKIILFRTSSSCHVNRLKQNL